MSGKDLSEVNQENPIIEYGKWLATHPRIWGEETIKSTLLQFVDLLAVTIPGSQEPVTKDVIKTVESWGTGSSTLICNKKSLSAPWAALVNGTAAHALDFDDNFDPAKAHASAVLIPAILALAEENQLGGMQCIDAYICGLQIMGKVGQGLNPYHRNRGWHATATVGAIGASAACARLLGLSQNQSSFALSISTSLASGFMSQFGTKMKPLHSGLAAKSGTIAASLAKNNITAGLQTFDGINGMNYLMIGQDYEQLKESISKPQHGQTLKFDTKNIEEPLHLDFYGFRVKRFPNCGSAHRAMDIMLNLRNKLNLTPEKIKKITVEAPISHLNNLMYNNPKNSMEAKFSMQFALSCILNLGRCGLSEFKETQISCPDLKNIYDKIELIGVDKSEIEIPTKLTIKLVDGSEIEEKTFFPVGSKNHPFSVPEYWNKFEECSKIHLTKRNYTNLRNNLEKLDKLESISTLMKELK